MVHTRGVTNAAIQQFEYDAKHWKLCQDDFTLIKLIGQGGEGSVYHAQHKVSGVEVALKRIPYSECFDNEHESRIHKELVHPNIVRLYGMFLEDDDDYNDYYDNEYGDDDEYDFDSASCWMILEYCSDGTMQHVMETTNFATRKVQEVFVCKAIHQILLALQYVHNKPHYMMHRDIKPANILWKHDINGPVLADFGMCIELKHYNNNVPLLLKDQSVSSSSSSSNLLVQDDANNGTITAGVPPPPRSHEFVGTIHYMAPEVLALEEKYRVFFTTAAAAGSDNYYKKGDDDEWYNNGYSYEADSWSLGITTFELLTGVHPFPIGDEEQFTLEVGRLIQNYSPVVMPSPPHHHHNNSTTTMMKFPDFVSLQAQDFITKLVQVDPKKRMSIQDALIHPWILRHVKQQSHQHHAAAAAAAAAAVAPVSATTAVAATTTTTISTTNSQDKENKPVVTKQQTKPAAKSDDKNNNDAGVKQVMALLGGLNLNKV